MNEFTSSRTIVVKHIITLCRWMKTVKEIIQTFSSYELFMTNLGNPNTLI